MKQLHFLAEWQKEKELSWSGTNYSLYLALQQFYQVKDCPLRNIPIINRIIRKYIPKLWDFGISDICRNRSLYSDIKDNVIQFSEILGDINSRKTYIYQDLCIDYLCYLHNNDSTTLDYAGYGKYSKDRIFERNKMQLDYYSHSSGILMMGKWMADYLIRSHPELKDKIYHVGGGINLDYKMIKPKIRKSNNKILFIGRDFRRKGGYDVIAAFEILRKKYSNLELHVAGPKINPLKATIPGYHFYGDASKDTVQYLMNNCDVFCMPSYFEAYGLVFIESLAFGLPCIGRNKCEMPYFIESGITGELIASEDVTELVQKIETILNDSSYKKNVEDRKNYYLNEYSWESVARRIANIMDYS